MPTALVAELLCIRSDLFGSFVNHIDNIQTATYSAKSGLLELRFHLLVIFGDAQITGFHLTRAQAGMDGSEFSVLDSTTLGSPGQVASFPQLSWAANSRFAVNTTVSAPGLMPGDLLTIAAKVGDQLRPVSRIYITGKAAAAAAESAEA